jgi:pantoate kinase
MNRLTKAAAALAALTLVAACGQKNESEGGLSAEDSQQLNNAAEMLDTSADSLTAGEDTPLGNGEEASAATANTAAGNGQ